MVQTDLEKYGFKSTKKARMKQKMKQKQRIYEISRTVTIDQNICYAVHHYIAATTPTLNLPQSIDIWLRDYVDRSQKEYGVMPKEELEASFAREPGKRRMVTRGVTESLRIKYDLFLNAIFYATQENLTFDLLIRKLLLQAIRKAQEQVGVISLDEMHARQKRAIDELLRDFDLNPHYRLDKSREKLQEEHR
jgi:hypothetical protein